MQPRNNSTFQTLSGWLISASVFVHASEPLPDLAKDQSSFNEANKQTWKEVFSDPATGDWKQKWFLDGETGVVQNDEKGMTLTAGPEFRNDAHHMVLWTKKNFEGDLKIDFDYTRLDNETRCVNILYIQATGSGEGPYAEDISKWNDLRKVPSMSTYFKHMHTYHISYAAFPNNEDATGYIRARRYMPEKAGLKGTELKPEYLPQGLFQQGVKHRITVIKNPRDLFMRIKSPEKTLYCHIKNKGFPVITEGRIGLRHMFTRSARYANFKVSIPEEKN
ncbi:MAG: DUF1961 family protein [Akkermansiaceae bacterium]